VLVRLSLGLLDSASDIGEQVRAEIAHHGHATTFASGTFCAIAWPKLVLGDHEGLERDSAELASFCVEKKVEQIRLLATLLGAFARAMREPVEANIATMRQARVALARSGGTTGNSIILSSLAQSLLHGDDLTAAEAALNDGFAFAEQSGERYWLADLHRLSGQVALRRPAPDRARAEACFRQAIEVARGQDARLLELRAANDLGQLWQGSRPNAEIRALVEPVLGQIEGGATAPDVRNARKLLAALG
jgi:predicted ATPase